MVFATDSSCFSTLLCVVNNSYKSAAVNVYRCGWLWGAISVRFIVENSQFMSACWAFDNNVPNSASASDDATNLVP